MFPTHQIQLRLLNIFAPCDSCLIKQIQACFPTWTQYEEAVTALLLCWTLTQSCSKIQFWMENGICQTSAPHRAIYRITQDA